MISEQDKRDFFDGAFGINQAGKKVKYIGTAATDQVFRYMVAVLNEAGDVRDIQYLNDLLEGAPTQRPHNNVVGLWENRVEPFCLEKALSGHPVKLRNGQKAYVLHDEENTYTRIAQSEKATYVDEMCLRGVVIEDPDEKNLLSISWTKEGRYHYHIDNGANDIVSMWRDEEPAYNTVTHTLPCPIKEPRNSMWFIGGGCKAMKATYDVNDPSSRYSQEMLEDGRYFATQEDAQAWLDALKNSRR